MGQNVNKMSPNALKFTPSHLSSFNDRISFDVFLRALSLSMTFGNAFDFRGLTLDVSYQGHVITITGDLQLKRSPCQ
jgi:hypothetical protein